MYITIIPVLGHFGTIILQIPVEDGHRGGELEIAQNGRRKNALKRDLSLNSDRRFRVTFLNVDCEHRMEPILCGWRIELEFHLWMPRQTSLRPIPKLTPFLVALVKKFL